MAFKFDDIEDAFFFQNMSPDFNHQAILCKDSEEIYYASDFGDDTEIPEDVYVNDACIELPLKNDLDLGQRLVFEFVENNLPEQYERVRGIFRSRGAYARYKDLLEEKGLLDRWYEFENDRRVQALKQWCADNGIALAP
jgi:hypothetical protein